MTCYTGAELKGEEVFDVVEDAFSLFDSVDNRGKIVVQNDLRDRYIT